MSNIPLPKSWTNVITGKCYERHQIIFYTKSPIVELQNFIAFFKELTAERVSILEHVTSLEDDQQKIIITFDKQVNCEGGGTSEPPDQDNTLTLCDLCGQEIDYLPWVIKEESDEGNILHLELCKGCYGDIMDDLE